MRLRATDDLLRENQRYAASFNQPNLPPPPRKKVAIVACMDARLDVCRLLGLSLGDAPVIRNARGVVTDDISARSSFPRGFSKPGRSC